MEINEMNYEMFALDYAEGNLSDAEAVAMEAFLAQHPSIKEEIDSICATKVPLVASGYSNKESLKRKKNGVFFLNPLTSAIAASLIVALGIMWFNAQKPLYGELAASQPAFTIHYSLDLTYRSVPVDDSGNRNIQEQTEKSRPQFADQNIPVKKAVESPTAEITEIFTASDNAEKNAVQYKVKMNVIDPVYIPQDDYFILPVTIELHDLSMINAENARQELDELAESETSKDARRRVLREGALTFFQQKIVPEGVNNLLSN